LIFKERSVEEFAVVAVERGVVGDEHPVKKLAVVAVEEVVGEEHSVEKKHVAVELVWAKLLTEL